MLPFPVWNLLCIPHTLHYCIMCVGDIYLILTCYITILYRQVMMTLCSCCPYLDTETPLTCLHYGHIVLYIAKFSRWNNFANRCQKEEAEISTTKIFAKAALIYVLRNTITWLLCSSVGSSEIWRWMNPSKYYTPSRVFSGYLAVLIQQTSYRSSAFLSRRYRPS